jgi:two-component system phosphate regulon sensor histidine kinase PhoR
VALLFGLLVGHWLLVTTLALAVYFGWQLFNTMRLHAWLGRTAPEPPESYGVWADIFDQIRLLLKSNKEQSLRHERVIEEFRSMTDAFPDATLVIDDADNITWFNDAARRLLGLKVPEDLGQPVTNLLRGPDFANWIAVEEKVQSKLEMPSPLDNNTFLSVSAVHYREDQRLLILRDVTDIHNLEQVRRDFVANVSHELRTPLTVLLGYLESMQGACPDDLSPAVDRMQEQARQMQALLNDLLELSRLQSDQPGADERNVDVPAMLMQLREQAEELSQDSHAIRFDIEPGLRLHGAQADLESAIRNLVNNAIHYTPKGGQINLKWWSDEEGVARLRVRDTGIGIPKRDIPRLTERFYRVGSDRSRHSGGTGLGLSIVKHVLNAHQARLVIDSELGEGSTFTCVFPRDRVRNSPEELAQAN